MASSETTKTPEEIAILVAGEIGVSSVFPIYSKNRGSLGVMRPSEIPESIRSRTLSGCLDVMLARFCEKRGWTMPVWSNERIANYVEDEGAGVSFVIDSCGGAVIPMSQTFKWLDARREARQVSRSFVPDQAASTAGKLFAHTSERHVVPGTYWMDHLGSIDGKISFSTEASLEQTLKLLVFDSGMELEDLIKRLSKGEDKRVELTGDILQIFKAAQVHPTREALMKVFGEFTGIDANAYPELKAVFLGKA